jgi:hypothetical protein
VAAGVAMVALAIRSFGGLGVGGFSRGRGIERDKDTDKETKRKSASTEVRERRSGARRSAH